MGEDDIHDKVQTFHSLNTSFDKSTTKYVHTKCRVRVKLCKHEACGGSSDSLSVSLATC